MISESFVVKNYGGTALTITGSTSPVNLSDLGLNISSDFGTNFELKWRIVYMYSTTSATPAFFTTQPSTPPSEHCWGTAGQMSLDINYGVGSAAQFADGGWSGDVSLPDFPYEIGTHLCEVVLTYLIQGATSASVNTVYPTVANAASGDTTYVACGYGIAKGF